MKIQKLKYSKYIIALYYRILPHIFSDKYLMQEIRYLKYVAMQQTHQLLWQLKCVSTK